MKKYGFSLVELIVTMAIIGILSGMVAPTFMQYQQKRKLSFSIDLVETALQKSFSNARSEPRIFGVKGEQNGEGYTMFSCVYKEEDTEHLCQRSFNDYKETRISFESGVKNRHSFFIQFLPPHGDIDLDSTIDETSVQTGNSENRLVLQNQKTQETNTIRVYTTSGLIEKLYE